MGGSWDLVVFVFEEGGGTKLVRANQSFESVVDEYQDTLIYFVSLTSDVNTLLLHR